MTNIKKESFSVFKDINEINSISEKKQLKQILKDFTNCICELNNIEKDLKVDNITENKDIEDFLIKLGVITNIEDINVLREILGKDYIEFISIIQTYLNLNIQIDESLKKYMDFFRKSSVENYLNDKDSPTLVDFFCGAGGMSLGFCQNGFKVLLANDIEDVCTKTYSFNHYEIPKERIITGDIKQIVENIDKHINDDVDVIIGGPPCQGFSMANRQRIIDDPRNVLYKSYVKGVEKLKPKFFVMENVKGMLSVAEQVKEDFHNLNDVEYDVAYNVFNAKDFCVAQNRERLIYIGIRLDISEKFKMNATDIIEEIKKFIQSNKKYNLIDAIGDLRELEALRIKNATELDTEISGRKIEFNRNDKSINYIDLINNYKVNKLIFNHKARYNNDRDIEIFGRMIPGDKSDSERIADIMPYKSRSNIFKDKYYKLKPNEVCKTITAHMKFDCNMYIHPYQARGLTPREAARVQSYPDDYVFLGSYTKTYMQVGNSVPPLMSRYIAEIIKKYI
ncbi:DNA cytosine methyltransferase [Negativicoccus succinicivorans]|uniref:Cytosine-specific methyltransferase n=2 Tax=Bacillota TaxID=1239 RepID=A0A6N3CS16_9FIRM|nr:DNA cytosine methyltransferase [Negativicoccus succinicivorans]ETI90870.1 MAG: Cytosine-specific methyltransferase [Negativicoccus succinicivorans DORA_17_25]